MAVHTRFLNSQEQSLHRGDDCPCNPDIEYIDPKTDLPYPRGPAIFHFPIKMQDDPEDRKQMIADVREDAREDAREDD